MLLDEAFQFLDSLSKENLKYYLKQMVTSELLQSAAPSSMFTVENPPTIILVSQNDLEFVGFCDEYYEMSKFNPLNNDG